jgi:hypothetical protein
LTRIAIHILVWRKNGHFPHSAALASLYQATGRSEFEDGLGSDDFVSGYSYHMSVHTGLADQTKQTKFQNQRPSDVNTSVPSIFWAQKLSSIRTVSTMIIIVYGSILAPPSLYPRKKPES